MIPLFTLLNTCLNGSIYLANDILKMCFKLIKVKD